MNDDPGRSAFDVPPPDPELRRLEPLLGAWRGQEHTQDSILGPGVPVTSSETFSWFAGGNNGPFTEEGNRYQGQVDDGTLTFVGPARFQYELDDAGKVKTNADGTITVAWWLRDERGEWAPWMRNTFARVTEKAT